MLEFAVLVAMIGRVELRTGCTLNLDTGEIFEIQDFPYGNEAFDHCEELYVEYEGETFEVYDGENGGLRVNWEEL